MKEKFLQLGLLWLRVFTGAGIAYPGYQKIFGGMIPKLTEGVAAMGFPMPEVFAWAASLSEFAGGILLILGLATRFAAFFIFFTMSVAAFIALKSAPLEGAKELALAFWTVSAALMMTGAGRFSLDSLFCKK